jgi:hypothetical protein
VKYDRESEPILLDIGITSIIYIVKV